jgi:hypothetical protein
MILSHAGLLNTPCTTHSLRLRRAVAPRAVTDVGHGPAHSLCQPMGAVASLGVSSASATLAEAPLVMHRAALLCRHLASERGVLDPTWASEGTSPLLAAHHSLQALAAASDASYAASLQGALAALQSSSSVDVEAIVGAVVSAVPSDGRALELTPVLAVALGAARQLAGLPSSAGAVQRLVHSGRAWALVGVWRLHMLVRSDCPCAQDCSRTRVLDCLLPCTPPASCTVVTPALVLQEHMWGKLVLRCAGAPRGCGSRQ